MRVVSLAFAALLALLPPPLLGGEASHDLAPAPVDASGREFLAQWCVSCHDATDAQGGLDLDSLIEGSKRASAATWERIYDRIERREMPPATKRQPPLEERAAFVAALGARLDAGDAQNRGTVLRRLNRREYGNTIADLLGVRVDVRSVLPEDSISHGFDNIGDALGMSEVQLRQYLEAAELALDELFSRTRPPVQVDETFTFVRDDRRSRPSGRRDDPPWLERADGSVIFFHGGGFPRIALPRFRAPETGTYRIEIRGFAHRAPTAQFLLNAAASGVRGDGLGEPLGIFEMAAEPTTHSATVTLSRGDLFTLSPRLEMNFGLMRDRGPAEYPGPGLGISSIRVTGPRDAQWPPRGLRLLFGDLLREPAADDRDRKRNRPDRTIKVTSTNPAIDSARGLRSFAEAAFRRPVDDAMLAPYYALFRRESAEGADFTEAMRTAAAAILCAPDFLYLVEPAGRLDAHALATRLSYFLWRSAPDDELLRLAETGQLLQPDVLRKQTERLLSAPRAERFLVDFLDAWLDLREIDATTPDRRLYPEYDTILRESMTRETREFFRELIAANLPPSTVIASDFAMLNSRLAEHYGLPPLSGLEIRRVELPPNSRRGGLLTQAAVLKVSANGTNTSPVIRGAFVLDRLLGAPPGPPPPGVPGLEPDVRGSNTIRELLEKHRADPSCRGCHNAIDPPGFALENYDVIGGWREQFRAVDGPGERPPIPGRPARRAPYTLAATVDASGTLPTGESFGSFAEFQHLVLRDPAPVTRCLAEKLLTFGTGREMGFSDRLEVARLVDRLADAGGGTRDLLHLLIQSPIFLSK